MERSREYRSRVGWLWLLTGALAACSSEPASPTTTDPVAGRYAYQDVNGRTGTLTITNVHPLDRTHAFDASGQVCTPDLSACLTPIGSPLPFYDGPGTSLLPGD